jgi:hypothetical protein
MHIHDSYNGIYKLLSTCNNYTVFIDFFVIIIVAVYTNKLPMHIHDSYITTHKYLKNRFRRLMENNDLRSQTNI